MTWNINLNQGRMVGTQWYSNRRVVDLPRQWSYAPGSGSVGVGGGGTDGSGGDSGGYNPDPSPPGMNADGSVPGVDTPSGAVSGTVC